MNAEPHRVVMADDHPQLRAHIRQALEAGGFEVCAEAANGPEAREATVPLADHGGVHISSVLRKLRVKDRQAAIDLLRDDQS